MGKENSEKIALIGTLVGTLLPPFFLLYLSVVSSEHRHRLLSSSVTSSWKAFRLCRCDLWRGLILSSILWHLRRGCVLAAQDPGVAIAI